MRKHKRLAALMMLALLMLVLFASSAYLVSASCHCCEKTNCEICKSVLRVKALLCAVLYAAAAASVRAVLLFSRGFAAEGRKTLLCGGLTLVGWKVRLNN
ncbi:MAG: hypothetical protein IKQ41_12255 [Clostridia bacterium]|nr:hypothetical protein [Clostridia bacterium]